MSFSHALLSRPHWAGPAPQAGQALDYLWGDARIEEDFAGDASEVLAQAEAMSVRARIVLTVGLYEQVLWRFEGLHAHEEPWQILEAAWCATVDPRYLSFFELPRDAWAGPIDSPLWCACTYLQHGLDRAQDFPQDQLEAIEFLYLLAEHVAMDRPALAGWAEAVSRRLAARHPDIEADPFDDLFERRVGADLGPLIGRDSLDPTMPDAVAEYDAPAFLQAVLNGAQQRAEADENPFLSTPEDLADLDFEGPAYRLPEIR